MASRREQLLQIARLVGAGAFAERFGPPQRAEPDVEALRSLVGERLDEVATSLVAEAAASDDVTDQPSALAYLDDRLRTLRDVIAPEHADRVRASFRERIKEW